MIPRSIWRWMILDIKRKKKEKRIRLLGGLIGICVAVVSLIYMLTSALAIYDSTADRVTFSDFVKDNMLAFFVTAGVFVLIIDKRIPSPSLTAKHASIVFVSGTLLKSRSLSYFRA